MHSRYWYPEAFVSGRGRSRQPPPPQWQVELELDDLADLLAEDRLSGRWPPAGHSGVGSRGRSQSLWDLSQGDRHAPNPNLTRLLDQEMKATFFEEALLGLMERRRGGWGGAVPAPARSRSLAELCRPAELPDQLDTHIYDYDRQQPYRSSLVQSQADEYGGARYQHAGRADPFLPPEGTPTYAPRMRCRRAEPPSGETPIAEKIYGEYQEKLVERMDRKASGSLRLNKPKHQLPPEPREMGPEQQVRQEFLGRVQERQQKLDAGFQQQQQPEEEAACRRQTPGFTIQGTADGISEAIADDVKYLLQQDGIWRPGSAPPPVTSSGQNSGYCSEPRNPESSTAIAEPVWTPAGGRSPTAGRREFRPVSYDASSLKRQSRQQQQDLRAAPSPSESFAWASPEPPVLTPAGRGNYQFTGVPRAAPLSHPAEPRAQPVRSRAKYQPLEDTPALAAPNEKLYTIKREYETRTDGGEPRRFADLALRPIDGVGPKTRQGMPVALKSAVKEEHQPEWYRLMYDSLHRAKPGRYDYNSGGYASEPEAGAGGRSHGFSWRLREQPDADLRPSSVARRPAYRNQPGRIEDYLPGHSSLAQSRQRAAGRVVADCRPSPSTRDIPDGYDSDSNLVFHRRDGHLDPVSGEQQRTLYSQIQRGGEVPLSGLHKPAPQEPTVLPQRGGRGESEPAGGEQQRGAGGEWRGLLQERQQESGHHADCFTSAHKSPIPLNRYDNLFDDVTIRSSRGALAKMAARALHSFKPINNRELRFNRGDIIFIRRQLDRNWLEGELNGRIGIFPVNYVQVVPIDGQRGGQPKLGAGGQARARYSFTAQTPIELSLKKGDLVTVLRRVDSNWLEGRLGARAGIFPASYVEVLARPLPERLESSARPTGGAPGGELQNQLHVDTGRPDAVPYKALYSYSPQNEDELELAEGDVVYVIEKCEDGWYVGTNRRSGMFGTFPGNYAQQV